MNVRTCYGVGPTQINHRLGYCFRQAVEDVGKWIVNGLGYNEKGVEFFRRLMHERKRKGRHIFGFGWMADRRIRHYLTLLGMKYVPVPVWRKEMREKSAMCPYHPKWRLEVVSRVPVPLSELPANALIVCNVRSDRLVLGATVRSVR